MDFEATRFELFLDRREDDLRSACLKALGELDKGPVIMTGPFRFHFEDSWSITSEGIDPNEVIKALQTVDFQHQPLLVYRSSGEKSWNWLPIPRKQGNLWDEGEEGK